MLNNLHARCIHPCVGAGDQGVGEPGGRGPRVLFSDQAVVAQGLHEVQQGRRALPVPGLPAARRHLVDEGGGDVEPLVAHLLQPGQGQLGAPAARARPGHHLVVAGAALEAVVPQLGQQLRRELVQAVLGGGAQGEGVVLGLGLRAAVRRPGPHLQGLLGAGPIQSHSHRQVPVARGHALRPRPGVRLQLGQERARPRRVPAQRQRAHHLEKSDFVSLNSFSLHVLVEAQGGLGFPAAGRVRGRRDERGVGEQVRPQPRRPQLAQEQLRQSQRPRLGACGNERVEHEKVGAD
mmetsp:Transcript_38917/g.60831  ORF Transcript_38917/g.60831 Transcript_38917/m.60831 type:complete len:292 (-) Transcript_38917:423-1298(-)